MRFGRFSIDTCARTLLRDGVRVDMQRQPFDLLVLLVEHANTVVTRDMIRARLWPDTLVDFDGNINYAIRQVRLALGDESGRLLTVPRTGYRFVGSVEEDAAGRTRSIVTPGRIAAAAAILWMAFGAGLVAAHTDSGAFIYEHIVHPDRCPYIRMVLPRQLTRTQANS